MELELEYLEDLNRFYFNFCMSSDTGRQCAGTSIVPNEQKAPCD